MKKLCAAFFAAMVLGGLPAASYASDGTITITGSISAQTCTINGGTSAVAVVLPTVSASTLSAGGKTAGNTPFSIALTGCSPNSGNVSVYFEPGSTVDTTTGRLANANGTASNVEVGLLNSDQTGIKLGAAQGSQNSQTVALSSGAATLNYYAQYYATGTVTSGSVDTSTLYSIVYD